METNIEGIKDLKKFVPGEISFFFSFGGRDGGSVFQHLSNASNHTVYKAFSHILSYLFLSELLDLNSTDSHEYADTFPSNHKL